MRKATLLEVKLSNEHVHLCFIWLVGWFVDRWISWSVIISLKRRKATLPCSHHLFVQYMRELKSK